MATEEGDEAGIVATMVLEAVAITETMPVKKPACVT
jgi:hypothetical protein